MKKICLLMIMFFSLLGGIFFAKAAYEDISEYEIGNSEYQSIEDTAGVTIKEVYETVNKKESIYEVPSKKEKVFADTEYFPEFEADFDLLKEQNSDFVGWIYYEPVDLSYPVVSDSKGNRYYETHTFGGESNSCGSIFLDGLCEKDMSSFNSVIYGHSMKDGSMFGNLKKIYNDASIAENNPYFYLFSEDFKCKYEIVGVYHVPADSDAYLMRSSWKKEEAKRMYDFLLQGKTKEIGYENKDYLESFESFAKGRYMVLSTCNGHNTGSRTVIIGKLKKRLQNKK